MRVEHVTAALEEQAWAWLDKRPDRKYSFVDATSFAVMRLRRLTEASDRSSEFADVVTEDRLVI